MKIFQLIDLIIRLFKLNKKSKVILLFLIPIFLGGQNNAAFWLGKRASGVAPFSYILDDFPNAEAAYSVRKLRSNYTGNAMQIRRLSDGATTEIGFANNELDISAINTWCAGTSCTVVYWFDQSGNNNHAYQTTAGSQPLIYSGGSVLLENGKPCMTLDGSNDWLNVSGFGANNANTSFFVLKRLTTNTGAFGLTHLTTSYMPASPYIQFDNSVYMISYRQVYAATPYNSTSQVLLTGIDPYVNNVNIYANGSLLISQALSFVQTRDINFSNIGRRRDIYGHQAMQELIYYTSDKTADRAAIETNINSYYSIY